MTVLAATSRTSNASLIADAVVPLGYIKPTDRVIDVTYGRGLWWKKYRHPDELFIGCVETAPMMGEVPETDWFNLRVLPDYKDMRVASNDYQEQFDVVCFDPPYISMGGRDTSRIPDFMDRFGLQDACATPKLLQLDNMLALRECVRICRPGGLLLVKCANYISSGKFFPGVHLTWEWAMNTYDLTQVDEFTMVGHSRAQPPGRRQVHARQNSSTLFVFQKPRRKP